MEVGALHSADQMVPRPSNVPADRILDFDIYRPLDEGVDYHRNWRALMDNARYPVMWTPHNGGHWIALRGDLSDTVMSDYERFSNNTILVPKDTAGEAYRLIPLSLDPPEHRPFRTLLNDHLGGKGLIGTDETIRHLAVELIEGFIRKGQCNFVHDFAEQLPVRIFMQIVDLPEADLPKLKHLADQFTRPDGSLTYPEVSQLFRDYMRPVIAERRGGAGTDMITRMVSGQVNGRDLTDEEAENICIQVLVGGLDTVVNFLGFTMSYLAQDAELRRALAADPTLIDDAVLEFFRRFPLVASAREVRDDIEWEGVQLKAGDMVMAPTIVVNLDDATSDAPLEFRLNRSGRRHSTFGKGSHTCPGSTLARMEMKIILREWLARIPEFQLAPGQQLNFANGIVGTVKPFVLEWPV
ncbi:MAG: cytochrome P450 [Sphingomonas sp.]|nr:cytochrome P450 [Sphingomonas sp.]